MEMKLSVPKALLAWNMLFVLIVCMNTTEVLTTVLGVTLVMATSALTAAYARGATKTRNIAPNVTSALAWGISTSNARAAAIIA